MLNKEKHRLIMFQILKDIFESNIGKYLAFKGGTACYFLHGLDRFSTDLDFDLLSDGDIDDELIKILKKYGTVKKGQKCIVSYGESDMNIKVDVSRKIWKNNEYEVINFYGIDMRVQTISTIFANKLVALSERSANRDIYDTWFFFKHGYSINEKIVFERTDEEIKIFLQKIQSKLLLLGKNYNILDGLGEVLTHGQKSFVKEKLLSELLGYIEFRRDF